MRTNHEANADGSGGAADEGTAEVMEEAAEVSADIELAMTAEALEDVEEEMAAEEWARRMKEALASDFPDDDEDFCKDLLQADISMDDMYADTRDEPAERDDTTSRLSEHESIVGPSWWPDIDAAESDSESDSDTEEVPVEESEKEGDDQTNGVEVALGKQTMQGEKGDTPSLAPVGGLTISEPVADPPDPEGSVKMGGLQHVQPGCLQKFDVKSRLRVFKAAHRREEKQPDDVDQLGSAAATDVVILDSDDDEPLSLSKLDGLAADATTNAQHSTELQGFANKALDQILAERMMTAAKMVPADLDQTVKRILLPVSSMQDRLSPDASQALSPLSRHSMAACFEVLPQNIQT